MNSKSPALSFWQPYAWFIVNGYADVDSRRWAPAEKYVGQRIFVHASKRKVTKKEFEDFLTTVHELKISEFPKSPDEFVYGAVVGSVVIDGVQKNSRSLFAHRGFFHWILSGAKTIKPAFVKGHRGWFSFNPA